MSASHYPDTNKIIEGRKVLFEFVTREDIGQLLEELDYKWTSGKFNADAAIIPLLRDNGYLDERGGRLTVNRAGQLFLGRLLLHFDAVRFGSQVFGTLNDKYKQFEVISPGKNSIVVRAKHRVLGTSVVLKLVRPGASADIASSIGRLSRIRSDSALVLPIDLLEVDLIDLVGNPVVLSCIVFPLVEGITFRQFLSQDNSHLNSQIVISFARQVGGALRELEQIGAYHGDLHEGNILVEQHSVEGGIRFRIVDISFDSMGSLPLEVCRNNDLSNFKQHIWRIISIQTAFIPQISLRKYIGTRNYLRIMKVLSATCRTFGEMCRALSSDAEFNSYQNEKANFLAAHFKDPVSFRLQRYEEITDPTVAVSLFVPFESLMEKIAAFSNVYVSGNRGSGKSTYLASLAFFPQVEKPPVEFRQTFGVYFPCRQGEFRPLATRPGRAKEVEQSLIVNVLVIKIIRRSLETVAAGVSAGRVTYPVSLHNLRTFMSSLVPPPGIVSVESDIQTELENFVSTMVRVEMDEISSLAEKATLSGAERDARTVIEFFKILRDTFAELASTQFHLLFDDAGVPYVPTNVQCAISDFMLASNPIFCIKLSAEKLTFEFRGSDGKILENGQDYFEHDISQVLFIGSGSSGLGRSVLEQYFRTIVEQRLSYFRYQSNRIVDYLGDNQIPPDELLELLVHRPRHAYYCGWYTVWNIADRTPRNLLELVSEIFSVGSINFESPPVVVPRRDQNRAIRTISEKRLESLSQISGSIIVRRKTLSLGRHLFETTAALGSTFRYYLRAAKKAQRKRQHLAIERNDFGELSPEAGEVLRKLITFGILDSGRVAYARDDDMKKPLYVLNRIYCPAFGIGFRRDDHLRLSKGKLEQLLLDPQNFMRDGTKLLRDLDMTEAVGFFRFDDDGD